MIDPLTRMSLDARLLLGGVLGAVAGSFLATLAIRWPDGRSVARGRSACDGCGRPLGPLELVPVLSFVARRGRCGTCGGAIERWHLGMEIGAAGIGMASLAAQPGWNGFGGAVFGWILLALAMLDIRHLWLPDRLTLPLLGLGLAAGLGGAQPPVADRLIGAAAAWLLLAAIGQAYLRMRGRIGMGGGDPKLFAAIGAWVGWHALPIVLLAASLAGLAAALALRIAGRPIDARSQLPFGAFLALAGWSIWLPGGM